MDKGRIPARARISGDGRYWQYQAYDASGQIHKGVIEVRRGGHLEAILQLRQRSLQVFNILSIDERRFQLLQRLQAVGTATGGVISIPAEDVPLRRHWLSWVLVAATVIVAVVATMLVLMAY